MHAQIFCIGTRVGGLYQLGRRQCTAAKRFAVTTGILGTKFSVRVCARTTELPHHFSMQCADVDIPRRVGAVGIEQETKQQTNQKTNPKTTSPKTNPTQLLGYNIPLGHQRRPRIHTVSNRRPCVKRRGAISATVRHRPATEQSKQKTKNKQFGGLEDPWWHQIHSQQTGWSQKTKESIPAGFIGICLGVWMFSTRVWILLVIGPFTVQTTHAFVALVVPSLHPLVDPIRHRYPHVTCISMFNRLACIVGAFVFGTNLHPRTKSPTAQFLALSFGRVVAG